MRELSMVISHATISW